MTTIQQESKQAITEFLNQVKLKPGDLFVLGGSTSEVAGKRIGTDSSEEIGRTIVKTIRQILDVKGIYLAVQGCEHINRALVIEREAAEKFGFEQVLVKPALHAGGALSMAAYALCDDPVMVEHVQAQAGMDIGDTEIAMHVKFVQIPIRIPTQTIGQARVTSLASRPKLIGGTRAEYPDYFSGVH